MKSFQTMPMHMCFLGIEESMNSKTSMLAYRIDHQQNTTWYKLIKAMKDSQERMRSVCLV